MKLDNKTKLDKTKMKLNNKIILDIILFISVLLVTGCSKINSKSKLTPTDIPDPDLVLTTSPSAGHDNLSGDKDSFDPESLYFPVMNIENDSYTYNYFNYFNQLPIVKVDNYIYEFSFYGNITLTDIDTGINTMFHITEKFNAEDYFNVSAVSDDWYYMGCLMTDNYIFLRYDYIGSVRYSMLFRMDLSSQNMIVCAAAPYYEKESLNNFLVVDDYIYYTLISESNNRSATSIIAADLSGNNEHTVFTLDENITAEYLFPCNNFLYMICTSKEGVKSLRKYDISSNTLSVILYNCTPDFLYIYDQWALLSISNDSYLCYYDMNNKKYYYLNLMPGSNAYYSPPFLSREGLYMAVFSWEDEAETKLARLDLKNKTIDKYILLSRNFYKSLGITDNILYVENGESYMAYNILTGDEIPLY